MAYQVSFPNIGTVNDDHSGDQFEPGAQKLFNNLAVTPWWGKTLNAGFFAINTRTGASLGLTAVQIIQAAINYAVANGFTAVYIPMVAMDGTVLLPYDASQVTFNNAVHMMCEDGHSELATLDARAYGAACDQTRDDYNNLQAALNAAAYHSGTGNFQLGTRVFIDYPGTRTSKPLWIKENGVSFVGAQIGTFGAFGSASIYADYYGGPDTLLTHRSITLPTTAGIISGHATAFSFPDNSKWFNLRDVPSLDINGLAQICVEAFINPPDNTGGRVVSSNGAILSGHNAGAGGAFDLSSNGGTLRGTVVTSVSGLKGPTSGAIPTNAVSHIALTYDGSNVRTFIGGVLQATVACTGTIVQQFDEDVGFPVQIGSAPDAGVNNSGLKGVIGPFRISNTARYTANFTPPADLTNDANTLALVNGDSIVGPFLQVQTTNGNGWTWCRWNSTSAGVSGVEVSNMVHRSGSSGAGTAGGIHIAQNCLFSRIKNSGFIGTRDGIYCPQNTYGHHWSDLYLEGQTSTNGRGRYGIAAQAGLGTLENFQVWFEYAVPLLLTSACVVSDGFVEIGLTTIYGAILLGRTASSQIDVDALSISTESPGAGAGFLAPLALSCGQGGVVGSGVNIIGGALETVNNIPHIIMDNTTVAMGLVKLDGTHFVRASTPASSIVQMTSGLAPQQPIQMNCRQDGPGSFLPWSDTAGTVVIAPLGKLPAITFSATPTFSGDGRDSFEITLTGNVTSSTLNNLTPGQRLTFWIKQDATGGRTFVWPTNVKGFGGIDLTPNKVSQQQFMVGIDLNAYASSPMIVGM